VFASVEFFSVNLGLSPFLFFFFLLSCLKTAKWKISLGKNLACVQEKMEKKETPPNLREFLSLVVRFFVAHLCSVLLFLSLFWIGGQSGRPRLFERNYRGLGI